MNPAVRRSNPSETSFDEETQRTGKKSTSVSEGGAEVSGVIQIGRNGFSRGGRANSENWKIIEY